MAERIQAIRGMNDIVPAQSQAWQNIQKVLMQCLTQYGYQEIRMPIVENTQLFKRTIGEVTDIIEKEMYSFIDLNGDSLTLRPEGTAGCVRACLEHGLLYNQQQKLWYCGPMFRHEKPQKGRYRQFHQFGVEVFGIKGVAIELELIAICRRLWNSLGIANALQLEVNTLGNLEERQRYRNLLVSYFKPNVDKLDADSKRRLESNPLRILDSKNPAMQDLLAEAPQLLDVVSDDSKKHFNDFCSGLTSLGIPYVINPRLVRGLDYYGHTVFEWVTDKLGSQSTICAGGRFDTLIEQLGGEPTPAVGFALGLERLILLRDSLIVSSKQEQPRSIFVIAANEMALLRALSIAEDIRNAHPGLQVLLNTAAGGLKSQFKKADKSGARLALIIGEDELLQKTISIKALREHQEQKTIPQQELNYYLEDYFR
ncbi:MAG: histidine--tRNA ligase [Legionella sp.]